MFHSENKAPTISEITEASDLNSIDMWPTDRLVNWKEFDDEPTIIEVYSRNSDNTFWQIEYRSGSHNIYNGKYTIKETNSPNVIKD